MSANLFALNNLIAQNLVTFVRKAPDYNTVYTATDGNILYINDDFGDLDVVRIVLEGSHLVAYDNNGFEYTLDDEHKVQLGASAVEQFFNPYGLKQYTQRQAEIVA